MAFKGQSFQGMCEELKSWLMGVGDLSLKGREVAKVRLQPACSTSHLEVFIIHLFSLGVGNTVLHTFCSTEACGVLEQSEWGFSCKGLKGGEPLAWSQVVWEGEEVEGAVTDSTAAGGKLKTVLILQSPCI